MFNQKPIFLFHKLHFYFEKKKHVFFKKHCFLNKNLL